MTTMQASMPTVFVSQVPANSLLGRYVASGAYADCYVTEVCGSVTHAQFVEAFYTTPLFRLERALLARFASRPSTDEQAGLLAGGHASSFAAWSVEERADNELLLESGRTRSWLMVAATPGVAPGSTRLYFGSAVVPKSSSSGESGGMGIVFHALLGFHKLYSRALLLSARARLTSRAGPP